MQADDELGKIIMFDNVKKNRKGGRQQIMLIHSNMTNNFIYSNKLLVILFKIGQDTKHSSGPYIVCCRCNV